MIDKATLLIAEEKLDVSFHTGTSPGHETIDVTLDRFNEPVHFPPDLPKTCPVRMTTTRVVSMLLVVLVVAAVAGAIVEFRLWGDGTKSQPAAAAESATPVTTESTPTDLAAPVGTKPAPPTSPDAHTLAEQALYQQGHTISEHVHMVSIIVGDGTTLLITQDLQVDNSLLYVATEKLGTKTETIQRNDGLCVRVDGGDWKTQSDGGARTTAVGLGLGLMNIAQHYFVDARREYDSKSKDGRDVYVISARAPNSLDAVAPDVPMEQYASAPVQSETLTFMIDKQTSQLVEEVLDIVFRTNSTDATGSQDLTERIDINFNQPNEPLRLPADAPTSCAHTNA